MRKILAAVIMGTFILTACGGNAEIKSQDTTESKAAMVTEGGAEGIKDEYTWTAAMNVSDTTLNYKMMERFKELIESKSGNKIKINLYPNGQLGNDTEQMQGLIEGTNDFVTTITSGMTSFVPQYAVFDCPNAFPDLDNMRAVLDDKAFVDGLNRYSEEAGIKLMGLADAGFRQTTSNTEVHTVGDFKGIKIRVIQNPYHISYWQSLGSNAAAMDFSEVYVGLQQKTIDAQENPYMNIVANKFYETQDYIIETNHLGHIIVFLMNETLYSNLPAEVQELVDQCAQEAIEYTRGLADESISQDKAVIEASGTAIITLDAAVAEEMREKASPVYDQIRSDIGDDLVDQLIASVNANKK
jgi:tripartite ATP-independent transporter DctP family solute receptor